MIHTIPTTSVFRVVFATTCSVFSDADFTSLHAVSLHPDPMHGAELPSVLELPALLRLVPVHAVRLWSGWGGSPQCRSGSGTDGCGPPRRTRRWPWWIGSRPWWVGSRPGRYRGVDSSIVVPALASPAGLGTVKRHPSGVSTTLSFPCPLIAFFFRRVCIWTIGCKVRGEFSLVVDMRH